MPGSHVERKATLTGVGAIVMWSASLGLFRSIAEVFGPTGGAALVFSVSGLLASAVLGWPSFKKLRPAWLFVCGALFVCYEICLALAIGHAHNRGQALQLGMINYLWPSLTIVGAVLTRQQRGSWWLLPGIVLCFAGIAWTIKGDGELSPRVLGANLHDNPLAYGMAFGAALLWAAYSLLTRRYGQGENAVPLFLLLTATVLWCKYALGAEAALAFSWSGLGQVLLLGTLTGAAYSCWNHGIQHGNLTVLASSSYFTPLLSAALASLWLGLRPSLPLLVGVLMVTAGSLLCWRATRAQAGR